MAAALALGAQGVWTGSMWLTVAEADTQPGRDGEPARRHVARHRAVAGRYTASRRASCARAWTEAWERPRRPARCRCRCRGSLHPYATRRAQKAGKELIGFPVGQIVSRMNQVRTDKQDVFDLVEGYLEASDRIAAMTEVE